jgi:nitroreductase
VGAFDDEAVKDLLSTHLEEEPLYIITIGYPK